MKTNFHRLLVNATGQLMHEHAFDHLSDEKLSRMNKCLRQLNQTGLIANHSNVEHELIALCSEANLYTETASPKSVHQWLFVMNCIGNTSMPVSNCLEEE